jgi:hypothetical protein
MDAFKSSLVPNPSERQSPLIWPANSGSPHTWCFPITAYQIHTSLAISMRTLSQGNTGREHSTHSLWKFTAHLHCAQTKRYNLCREKKIYDLCVINLREQSTNSLLTLCNHCLVSNCLETIQKETTDRQLEIQEKTLYNGSQQINEIQQWHLHYNMRELTLTRAPITPRLVRRKYSKGRVLLTVFRNG